MTSLVMFTSSWPISLMPSTRQWGIQCSMCLMKGAGWQTSKLTETRTSYRGWKVSLYFLHSDYRYYKYVFMMFVRSPKSDPVQYCVILLQLWWFTGPAWSKRCWRTRRLWRAQTVQGHSKRLSSGGLDVRISPGSPHNWTSLGYSEWPRLYTRQNLPT